MLLLLVLIFCIKKEKFFNIKYGSPCSDYIFCFTLTMVFMWIVISIKVVFLGICDILKGEKQKIASGFLGFVNIIFQYLKKGKAK